MYKQQIMCIVMNRIIYRLVNIGFVLYMYASYCVLSFVKVEYNSLN